MMTRIPIHIPALRLAFLTIALAALGVAMFLTHAERAAAGGVAVTITPADDAYCPYEFPRRASGSVMAQKSQICRVEQGKEVVFNVAMQLNGETPDRTYLVFSRPRTPEGPEVTFSPESQLNPVQFTVSVPADSDLGYGSVLRTATAAMCSIYNPDYCKGSASEARWWYKVVPPPPPTLDPHPNDVTMLANDNQEATAFTLRHRDADTRWVVRIGGTPHGFVDFGENYNQHFDCTRAPLHSGSRAKGVDTGDTFTLAPCQEGSVDLWIHPRGEPDNIRQRYTIAVGSNQ